MQPSTASEGPSPSPVTEALEFLTDFATECGPSPAGRRDEVVRQLRDNGSYRHTTAELQYGGRVAWRNAVNCVGRAYWQKLRVIDARTVTSAEELFEACVTHLQTATNGGKIQLLLTVFPQQEPGQRGFRIWNSQLIRYAGHRQADGSVVGDPQTEPLTTFLKSRGWRGSGGPFDVLPLVVQSPDGRINWFNLPARAVLEVPIAHPSVPGFDRLGLRWYAHPAISHQRLQIGGVSYPAAPFSGWYTCAEIAARNLSDRCRYNVLSRIAALLGLDTRNDRTLWKERALLELMTAVLYSYDRQGVTIVDHHFAAASLVRHEERERQAGRVVPGDWRKLIPVSAPATTEVFHRTYPDIVRLPNFFPQPLLPDVPAANRAPRTDPVGSHGMSPLPPDQSVCRGRRAQYGL